MTNPTPYGQVPEALRLANEFKLCNEYDSIPSITDIAKAEAELRRQHARIAELEAEIAAVGAGGVSGPLVGRASISANAGEPRKVFLVATGEEHEGEATYTRYDDKPPPLCDSECLFAAPPTAQAEVAKLRGQRMVLCSLLRVCMPVIDALMQMPGDDDSDARLNGLAGMIMGALNALAEDQVNGGES